MKVEDIAMRIAVHEVRKRVSRSLQSWLSLTERRQRRRVRMWDPGRGDDAMPAQREPSRV